MGGVVQRGASSTLTLTKLCPKKTGFRAPGPGPIRKKEWQLFAKKHLKGRNIILHSDGARSYRFKLHGVMHDYVVHKKKLIIKNGVRTWLKPKFTQVVRHMTPDGAKMYVKSGTQIIDRFWSHLRGFMQHRSAKPGTWELRRRVRMAQWTYWHRSRGLWSHAGAAIQASM